ncbi:MULTISPECIES: DUF975 family protein [unclassified Lactobacillus]|uniref:DUF975 family protein n=1 Tax=unclassified Lactobacillus TaxID=2620435 RepID=UPI000EFB4A77|nr:MULTISPECIES: DUF975 family protein [unclassified Lactobacillus]RMC38741.1 DUF975 family protein [Lactobacillus sp. ESL0237]RMC43086.1 DUF975 family protein [Lactobacillus sp. ESL0234]RMC43940.1 DUF975 family protein [Lactobacillus sp. ESL0236]RMC48187.1 DUF975 family protein [Lactobacillus sp. ESL0225]
MNRAELKAEAKKELRGNWGWAACMGLIIVILNGLIFGYNIKDDIGNFQGNNVVEVVKPYVTNGTFFLGTGLGFLSGFFMLSMVITFLHLSRGHKHNLFKAVFSVFTDNRFIPEFLNYLCSYIFQNLWTLLLVVPGIIKSYSYALTPYIVSDLVESGKEVHATTGITESRRLMVGHKWQLFVLDLSFLGWYLIGLLTLGIGFIWIVPYVQTTKANFYRQLAGDQFN